MKEKNKKGVCIIKVLLLPVFLLSFSNLLFSLQFVNTYSGYLNEAGYSIKQTSDGGYIVAGTTNSFGAGNYDFLIIKLTNNGEVEWAKTIGGGNAETPTWNIEIIQTSDGKYLMGGHTYSWGSPDYGCAIVSKLDENGNHLWTRIFTSNSLESFGGIMELSDGYLVIGETYSGGMSFFLAKLNFDGNLIWQKKMDVLSWELPWGLTPTQDGGFVFCGLSSSSGGYSDIIVAKFDQNANAQWVKTFGTSDKDEAYWVSQTSDGGYICISGIRLINGPIGYIVSKLDANGNHLWSKELVNITILRPRIIESPLGGYLLTCRINDKFGVLKLNSDGTFAWAKTISPENATGFAAGITITSDGGFIVTGRIGEDLAVVKFDQDEKTCLEEPLTITVNDLSFTAVSTTPTFPNVSLYSSANPTITTPSILPSNKCLVGGEEDDTPPSKDKNLTIKPILLNVPTFIKDKISLKFSGYSEQKLKIILCDISGNEIISKSYPFTYSIDIKGEKIKKLKKGIYFLKIYSGEKEIGNFKIIKK